MRHTDDITRVKLLVAILKKLGAGANLDPRQFMLNSDQVHFDWTRTRQSNMLSGVLLINSEFEVQRFSAEEFIQDPNPVLAHLESTQDVSFETTIVLLTRLAKYYKGEFRSHGTEGIEKHLDRAVKEVKALAHRFFQLDKREFKDLQEEVETLREENVYFKRKLYGGTDTMEVKMCELFDEMQNSR